MSYQGQGQGQGQPQEQAQAQAQRKVGVGSVPRREQTPLEPMAGGPLVNVSPQPSNNGTGTNPASMAGQAAAKIRPRSKLERVGFWFIVVAALALIFVLAGVILPPLVGGIISASYISAFVGFLTLMNLNKPAGWANTVLGRKVFPVVRSASDAEVWRLAGVNGALVFVFAFFYQVLAATFIGPFIAGLIVFGGLVALGIFYNRVRRVVVKP